MNVLKDTEFQRILLSFICKDRGFLRDVGYLLEADDFKPVREKKEESGKTPEYVIAKLALDYYKKTREPLGGLLRTEVIDYADTKKLPEKRTEQLLEVVKIINTANRDIISIDSVSEKIIKFKKTRLKKKAVEKAIDLLEKGELTDEAWYKICQEAIETFGERTEIVDYLESAEARIRRRDKQETIVKYPLLFIDPLDETIRAIARRQTGLVLAPAKGGKSLFLLWIAIAYAFQGLNVIYYTLEDGEDITTDRLDAMLTGICIKDLGRKSKRFRKRFKRIRTLIHSRIRIIDGTSGGWSIARMEEEWEKHRNQGFIADAIFCDYDEEVEPPTKYGKDPSAIRFQLSDIHKEWRRFIARRFLFGWMAAQTNRKADGIRIISKRTVGEDWSKIKKTHCCLGVGEGEWGEDSKYINVTASKNDKQGIGWDIMTDFEKGIFFDREATLRMQRKQRKKQKKEKD